MAVATSSHHRGNRCPTATLNHSASNASGSEANELALKTVRRHAHAAGKPEAVVVALDADTHFEKDEISKLVRWFGDPAVGGTESFYDSARTFSSENRRLATDLQAAMVAALGTADRGVWTDDQLAAPTLTSSGTRYGHLIELGPMAAGWVDNPSLMPGALVEPLFLSNPTEAGLASDPSGQKQIALALEAGLVKFLTAH